MAAVMTAATGCGSHGPAEIQPTVSEPEISAVMSCSHQWNNGVCSICAESCSHQEHDASSLLCSVCGVKVTHSYINCLCVCGASPQFITNLKEFPLEVLKATEEEGTLEYYVFGRDNQQVRTGKRSAYTDREFIVYTPYGYDPSKQYNVLVLTHGTGMSCHDWLEKPHILNATYSKLTGKYFLDSVIANTDVEPLIVVSTEYRNYGTPAEIAEPYAAEIRECILPFIAENYSTYATVDENGDFVPSREHFAFAGVSFGSMIIWDGFMSSCEDLFSNWGTYSGNLVESDEMAAQLDAAAEAGLTPDFIYSGGGADEDAARSDGPRFHKAAELCDTLVEGQNAVSIYVEYSAHRFDAWNICLYNSLQVFFLNRFVP